MFTTVLAQLKPAAATLSEIYAVPENYYADLSAILVTNQQAVYTSFSISILAPGATDDAKQYIFKDTTLKPNQTLNLDFLLNMTALASIKVESASGEVSFNLIGKEIKLR